MVYSKNYGNKRKKEVKIGKEGGRKAGMEEGKEEGKR